MRRVWLDRIIVLNERRVRVVVQEWVSHTTGDGLMRAWAQEFPTYRPIRWRLEAIIAFPMGTEASRLRSSVGCIENRLERVAA
jgi:hypothetical protein